MQLMAIKNNNYQQKCYLQALQFHAAHLPVALSEQAPMTTA